MSDKRTFYYISIIINVPSKNYALWDKSPSEDNEKHFICTELTLHTSFSDVQEMYMLLGIVKTKRSIYVLAFASRGGSRK